MQRARARLVLELLSGLYAASMGMSIPLVFQYLEVGLGASATVIGAIGATFGGVQVFVRLPLGAWLDRHGGHGVLLVSWALTAAAGALFLVAGSVLLVLLAMLVYGLAVGLYWVAAYTLLSRLAPEGDVARTMTRYMVALGVGFLVGPTAGGLADLIGFRRALGVLVGVGLLGLLVEVLAHPSARARPIGTGAAAEPRGIVLGLAGAFTFGFVLGAADAFIPVHLAAAGYSALAVGLFFSGREAANLGVRLASVRAVRDATAPLFLLAAAVLLVGGLVLFPRAVGVAPLALAALLTGAGIGLLGPSSLTLTARASADGERGRAMGRYGAALGGGMLVGPALVGPLGDALGRAAIFDATAAVSALLAGLVLLERGRGRLKQRARSAPAQPPRS